MTEKVHTRVKRLEDRRGPIHIPLYVPITAREATLEYPGTAMGGWVTAIAIDVLPLVMLLMVMVTSREELMTRPIGPVLSYDPVDYDGLPVPPLALGTQPSGDGEASWAGNSRPEPREPPG